MAEQIALFDSPERPHRQVDKQRRKWENGFQRWSNKSLGNSVTHYGKCGYGSMCDYCEDYSYGRPCVRALNAMCRKKSISIDYKKTSFKDAWEGEFNNG